jgi:hypothetical protein
MQSTLILARQYGPRTAATLNALISTLGATNPCKLLIDGGQWTIDANVTIPASIVPEILPDAQFVVSVGCTLTIASQYFMFYRTDWKAGLGSVVTPDPVAISVAATQLTGGPDLDNLVESGEYYGSIADELPWTSSPALPTSLVLLPAYVKVVKVDVDNVIQTFTSASTIASSYTRSLVNGIWGGWILLSARMATSSEVKAMTSETVLLNPLLLQNFLHINYAYTRKTDSELVSFPLAYNAVGKAAERKEPAVRFGLTITPKLADSKILLYGVLYVGTPEVANAPRIYMNRSIAGAAAEEISNATEVPGTYRRACFGAGGYCNVDSQVSNIPILLIDDVAGAGSREYFISFSYWNTAVVGINRSNTDTDYGYGNTHRVTSHLFAVELPQKT